MGATTLPKLKGLSLDELGSVFRRAKSPDERLLSGDIAGEVVGMGEPRGVLYLFLPVTWLSDAGRLPWRGRTFFTKQGGVMGINRVLSDRFRLFRFKTAKEPSLLDGKPVLHLDYRLPTNPLFIR